MKKIVFTILALVVLSLALSADMVTASKDGEKVAILQGHADRFNNQTNTWEFDDGAEISSINFFNTAGTRIGYVYSSDYPVTNSLGDFILLETASIYWFPLPDDPFHNYNLSYVDYLKYTYHGTQFTAEPGDSVLLEFIQGY